MPFAKGAKVTPTYFRARSGALGSFESRGMALANNLEKFVSTIESRPLPAIGHVRLHCKNLDKAKSFYLSLGMRYCMSFPGVHVLELRGGTHLLLIQSPDEMMEVLDPLFDLIVDDLEGFRERLAAAGINGTPTTFHELIGHHRFFVTDPDGRRVAIHSSHTEGRPV